MPHKEDIRKWCLMFYLEMQGPSVFLELVTLLHPFLLRMQHGNLSLCKLGLTAKTYSILTFFRAQTNFQLCIKSWKVYLKGCVRQYQAASL